MISIVIPAHNEAKYITETLNHIQNLSYPRDSFEVLVIENGSIDDTYAIAKKFDGGNIRVFKVDSKGVSKAKNFGMEHVSGSSEWIIFLDADTILKSGFLKDLDLFLKKNSDKNFVIGTTSVKPLENESWYSLSWMKFYDLGHKYTKTSFAIQIMLATLREKVKFNEKMSLAEDLQFIQDCLAYGKFFYFDTDCVLTSVRRFEKIGWIKLFIKWNFDALVWRFNKKPQPDYKVIR